MSVLVNVVSTIAAISYLALALSPTPDVRRIHQTRSVGATPFVPLAALLTSAWIWTLYCLQAEVFFPLLTCSLVGLLLAVGYTTVYYFYTDHRAYANKVFACFGFLCVGVAVYALLGGYGYTNQSRDSVKTILGHFGTVASVVFFIAPFENIKLVFRRQSSAFIPIEIVAATAVKSVVWIAYSLLISDRQLFALNALGLTVSGNHVALYLHFLPRSTPGDSTDGESPLTLVPFAIQVNGSKSPEFAYGRLETPSKPLALLA